MYHQEPSDFLKIWRKNIRYGKSLKELLRSGIYRELLERRDKGFRKFTLSKIGLRVRSFLLLLLLKTSQKIGYWIG